MKQVDRLIDVSAWTGNWPFLHLRYGNLQKLQQKLTALCVAKAYVSPIEGILEQDPMRANLQLFKDIEDDFFSPVPIIDLSLANWGEMVQRSIDDGRVKMLKLLPNYHMYELDEARLKPLVTLAQQHGWVIAIQIRVEDRRGQYPLMKVEDVDAGKLVKVVSHFPEQSFIFQNLFLPEVSQVLPAVNNVYVDLASLEHTDVLHTLQEPFSLDRCLFSTHAPFYFPEGNVYKLKYSEVALNDLERVGHINAEQLFGIDG